MATIPLRRRFTQADRSLILDHPDAEIARKSARIVAIPMVEPFTVDTDRGVMSGEAGDWLVTNHPDDDAGSDVWTISAERMAATYQPEE